MGSTIESGLCQCGCGDRTAISKWTDKRIGAVKGQPRRFINGHQRRGAPIDYIVEDRGYSTPCWIWHLSVRGGGYGQMWADGRLSLSHRVFYERRYGPVPDDLQLDHLCRVRPCVNPDHLEPVTQAINTQRGRLAKLTAEQVVVIRQMAWSSGWTQAAIAAKFGVGQDQISRIKNRRSWANV